MFIRNITGQTPIYISSQIHTDIKHLYTHSHINIKQWLRVQKSVPVDVRILVRNLYSTSLAIATCQCSASIGLAKLCCKPISQKAGLTRLFQMPLFATGRSVNQSHPSVL